jgi:hypothetical protein
MPSAFQRQAPLGFLTTGSAVEGWCHRVPFASSELRGAPRLLRGSPQAGSRVLSVLFKQEFAWGSWRRKGLNWYWSGRQFESYVLER